MPKNPEFMQLLQNMSAIHEKKNDDYSSGSPDENFERMAVVQSWFKQAIDKSFVGMVAVKLARLAVLLSKDESPNNESIEDSFLDLCTYCCLWAANYMRRTRRPTIQELEYILNMPDRAVVVNIDGSCEADPRLTEIYDICAKLPEDKLAKLTAEARRLVM